MTKLIALILFLLVMLLTKTPSWAAYNAGEYYQVSAGYYLPAPWMTAAWCVGGLMNMAYYLCCQWPIKLSHFRSLILSHFSREIVIY
jgi:hypothetical protein